MKGFEIVEYKERVAKALKLMEKNNIEMLLITSPQNFRYFSGLDSYFWESPTRPWFLVISKNNPVKAIIPSIGITAMENTFINKINLWNFISLYTK